MDVSLVRVQENGKSAELAIKRSAIVFGRGDEANVRIPAAGVSRTHCRLLVTEDGSITIEDLGSSNGTYLNQERIEKAPVSAGDLISFGGFVFVVRVNGDPDDIDVELSYEDGVPEEENGAPAKASPAQVTQTSAPVRAPLVSAGDAEDSSVVDFDFDLDDDEDDQPPL